MDNWQYHDNKMRELKKVYNRISKQTQNELQNIFDSYKIDFEHLYNMADNKTLNRVKTKIEEWKDKGLLNGYFEMLANNIYKRTRVKNNEILEFLIYGAYIEEQNKLEKTEINTFKDVANYYYQEGQKEVNKTLPKKKRKFVSVIPDAIFLALLDMQNEKGYIWKQYVEAVIKYNADQVYRQAIINIQQNKDNNIDDSIYQNIILKQQNSKLSINQDKISGAVDNELIGLNNLAKVEGIKSVAKDDDSQIEFWAVTDENSTDMCQSMNGMRFYINKENSFDRYWGETQKELKLVRVKVKGLVIGVNLPPIAHHKHYCRSTIRYVPPVEKEEKTEYNLDIAKINKDIKPLLKDVKLNSKTKKLFSKYLTDNNIVIDKNNEKPMYYSIDEDKIIINPEHPDFEYYKLEEALPHEIVHLIDSRNKLLENNRNIYSNIRSAGIEVNLDIDKYNEIFKEDKYFYDLCSGDTIGLLTGNKVKTFYYHPIGYTNIEEDIVANIETAYLTDNKLALKLFENSHSLKKLKDKVVKMYDKYTK